MPCSLMICVLLHALSAVIITETFWDIDFCVTQYDLDLQGRPWSSEVESGSTGPILSCLWSLYLSQ